MADIFLEEVLSQPRIVREILDHYGEDQGRLQPVSALARQRAYDLILLTGMGTSHYALYPACIYLNERGVPAVMLETSELLHYYQGLITDRVLVTLVSQSGESAELRKLLDEAGDRTVMVSVTNNAESYVARNSDLHVAMCAGPERGPASKSYTASLAVLLLCALALSPTMDRRIVHGLYEAAEAMESFLERWEEPVDRLADFLAQSQYLALLGRGPSLASTEAGSLILKEVAKVQGEAMSSGQFRHGSMEVATSNLAAFVFAPHGKTRDLNLRLAHDIAGFGGRAVIIGGNEQPQHDKVFNLALPPLDELYAPLVEVVPIQLLARKMALDRGLAMGFSRADKVTRAE